MYRGKINKSFSPLLLVLITLMPLFSIYADSPNLYDRQQDAAWQRNPSASGGSTNYYYSPSSSGNRQSYYYTQPSNNNPNYYYNNAPSSGSDNSNYYYNGR